MTPPDVTALLKAWSEGDASAFDELVPLVYRELHRIARHCMAGERAGHSLQPTALLNEAFVRLADGASIRWQDRSHFLATSARLMRRILVDVARSKQHLKRNRGKAAAFLSDARCPTSERGPDLVALDLALQSLAQIDTRKSRVVELRFFGGFSVEETAAVLNVSHETVYRDWRLARAWLRRELRRGPADEW